MKFGRLEPPEKMINFKNISLVRDASDPVRQGLSKSSFFNALVCVFAQIYANTQIRRGAYMPPTGANRVNFVQNTFDPPGLPFEHLVENWRIM